MSVFRRKEYFLKMKVLSLMLVCLVVEMTLPEVGSYLSGSKVLVTGVTGFVGLALVEKLLRTVPGIGSIYVLIRPKRGKSMEDRLNEIKQSSVSILSANPILFYSYA